MPHDRDLEDGDLKLVRYKILFVKRDFEFAFPEREELVHDDITGGAFTAWKVAEFLQGLSRGETPVPHTWETRGYPPGCAEGGKLKGLPDEDKKYLRVYYEVLERYVREAEDDEVDVLKEIRGAINNLPSVRGGGRGEL